MEIIMSTDQLSTINDIELFINGARKVAFTVLANKQDKYQWVQMTLIKFNYLGLNKHDKGIVRLYLQKITKYSNAQVTRLISKYKKYGCIAYNHYSGDGFIQSYTKEDVLALVAMDELHETLNGVATKKLCERAWLVYNDVKYQKLANISVSHLYNLRDSSSYKNHRLQLKKTKPVKSNIGKKRKPRPNGVPGYSRVDTVHQGDYDKNKGVYHINAVDEVTQFERVRPLFNVYIHAATGNPYLSILFQN
jgi:hypothetical protein